MQNIFKSEEFDTCKTISSHAVLYFQSFVFIIYSQTCFVGALKYQYKKIDECCVFSNKIKKPVAVITVLVSGQILWFKR